MHYPHRLALVGVLILIAILASDPTRERALATLVMILILSRVGELADRQEARRENNRRIRDAHKAGDTVGRK